MKRLIVTLMERACAWFDKVPVPYRFDGHWHVGGGLLGCYLLRLAERSARLDERWGTEVWK